MAFRHNSNPEIQPPDDARPDHRQRCRRHRDRRSRRDYICAVVGMLAFLGCMVAIRITADSSRIGPRPGDSQQQGAQ